MDPRHIAAIEQLQQSKQTTLEIIDTAVAKVAEIEKSLDKALEDYKRAAITFYETRKANCQTSLDELAELSQQLVNIQNDNEEPVVDISDTMEIEDEDENEDLKLKEILAVVKLKSKLADVSDEPVGIKASDDKDLDGKLEDPSVFEKMIQDNKDKNKNAFEIHQAILKLDPEKADENAKRKILWEQLLKLDPVRHLAVKCQIQQELGDDCYGSVIDSLKKRIDKLQNDKESLETKIKKYLEEQQKEENKGNEALLAMIHEINNDIAKITQEILLNKERVQVLQNEDKNITSEIDELSNAYRKSNTSLNQNQKLERFDRSFKDHVLRDFIPVKFFRKQMREKYQPLEHKQEDITNQPRGRKRKQLASPLTDSNVEVAIEQKQMSPEVALQIKKLVTIDPPLTDAPLSPEKFNELIMYVNDKKATLPKILHYYTRTSMHKIIIDNFKTKTKNIKWGINDSQDAIIALAKLLDPKLDLSTVTQNEKMELKMPAENKTIILATYYYFCTRYYESLSSKNRSLKMLENFITKSIASQPRKQYRKKARVESSFADSILPPISLNSARLFSTSPISSSDSSNLPIEFIFEPTQRK